MPAELPVGLESSIDQETPLDLLLNAITEPIDTNADVLAGTEGVYAEGAFGLANEKHGDCQESHAVDTGGGDGSTHQEPVEDAQSTGVSSDAPTTALSNTVNRLLVDTAVSKLNRTGAAGEAGSSPVLSTIRVWHPTAAQKSYGRERRFIGPPPFVRVHGPLQSRITSVSLNTTNEPERTLMSSQTHKLQPSNVLQSLPATPPAQNLPSTHHLPGLDYSIVNGQVVINEPAGARLTSRKLRKLALQEANQRVKEQASKSGFAATLPHERTNQAQKDREALQEGLSFPGLWCAAETAKAKMSGCRLGLEIRTNDQDRPAVAQTASENEAIDPSLDAGTPAVAEVPSAGGVSEPWLKLGSSSIAIISKPSIKTAKARSMASCLDEDCTFSLCVRIHAQTVRTKYFKTDSAFSPPALTTRTGKWDPYTFDILQRPKTVDLRAILDPEDEDMDDYGAIKPKLFYGSIVRLRDVQTGAVSPPMKLVRTDKNEANVGEESGDGDPVSDLQKVAFVHVIRSGQGADGQDEWQESIDADTGGRLYLAAPGVRIGGAELRDAEALGSRRKRAKGPQGKDTPGDAAALGRRTGLGRATGSGLPSSSTPGQHGTDNADTAHRDEDAHMAMADRFPETLADTLLHNVFDPTLGPHLDDISGDIAAEAPAQAASNAPQQDSQEQDPANDAGMLAPESADPSAQADEEAEKTGKKRQRTKRLALAQAVVDEEDDDASIQLIWQAVSVQRADRIVGTSRASKTTKTLDVEQVGDWMTFLITGVDQFSTSFCVPADAQFSAVAPPANKTAVRCLTPPRFDKRTNTIQVVVNEDAFAQVDANYPHGRIPPQIYIGSMGPLSCDVLRSTTVHQDIITVAEPHPDYARYRQRSTHEEVRCDFPAREPHLLLCLGLPPMEVLRRAVDDLTQAISERMRDPDGTPRPLSAPGTQNESGAIGDTPGEPVGTRTEHPAALPVPAVVANEMALIDPDLDAGTRSFGADTSALPLPSDFDAEMAALRDDLGLGQPMGEPSWLTEYTSAVQGDMDDTQAIRLALQNVTDGVSSDMAGQVGINHIGMDSIDPGIDNIGQNDGDARPASTTAQHGTEANPEHAHDQVGDLGIDQSMQQNQASSLTHNRVLQQPVPVHTDQPQAAEASEAVHPIDGPVLLSLPGDVGSHGRLGETTATLPILVIRQDSQGAAAVFDTEHGLSIGREDEVVTVVKIK